MGGVHEQNWLSIKKSSPQEEDMYLKTLSGVLELKSTQMYICESLDKKKAWAQSHNKQLCSH